MLIAILSSLTACSPSVAQAEETAEHAPAVYGYRALVPCDDIGAIDLGSDEVWAIEVWYCTDDGCLDRQDRWGMLSPGVVEIYQSCKGSEYLVTWLSAES
jgi:hypothetical protein